MALSLSDPQSDESEGMGREQATALLMACRHLPEPVLSTPGQRSLMLAEAAKVYEQLGDKKSVQDCHRMMMRLEEGRDQTNSLGTCCS